MTPKEHLVKKYGFQPEIHQIKDLCITRKKIKDCLYYLFKDETEGLLFEYPITFRYADTVINQVDIEPRFLFANTEEDNEVRWLVNLHDYIHFNRSFLTKTTIYDANGHFCAVILSFRSKSIFAVKEGLSFSSDKVFVKSLENKIKEFEESNFDV